MNQRIRLAVATAVLFVFPTVGFTQQAEREKKEPRAEIKEEDKEAKPQIHFPPGYEQAAAADERPAAAKAAAAEAVEDDGVEQNDVDVFAEKVEPNVANLENQFLPRMRPLLKAELSFVKRVCRPDRRQRQVIAGASERCLKVAVRKYAMGQVQLMGGRRGRPSALPVPNRLIQEELLKVIRGNLDPRQAERYEQEVAKRVASRQHAAVLGMVAKLDNALVLSHKQREQLCESLSKHWQEPWNQSWQMVMLNNQYLPQIPDKNIVPLLNERQRDVWRRARKQGHIYRGWFGNMGAGVLDDFDVELEVASEEAAAAGKNVDKEAIPADN